MTNAKTTNSSSNTSTPYITETTSSPQPRHSPPPSSTRLWLPLGILPNFPASKYPRQGILSFAARVAWALYSLGAADHQCALVLGPAAAFADWRFVEVVEPALLPTRVFPDFVLLVRQFLLAIGLSAGLAMVILLLPKMALLHLP
ncbi:uncharacterized protein V1513DRAFT_460136 [Lipomyces chichibuensis]|uniref:uncharacterized protein n=1 Tax=Lipomyces chichibuensis TaxID=1546026 RepID=UPI0033436476